MDREINDREEVFSFWKNLVLVTVFFTITPLVLSISIFSLLSFSKTNSRDEVLASEITENIYQNQSGVRVFASLPANIPSIDGSAKLEDARAELIKNYLASYDSPLTPYASFVVSTADKYKLDFRLTTAIAQQESNLCKIIPPGTHNCWGWGIHSQGTLGFDSFEEGIEVVSKGLRENYLNKGLETVDQIEKVYTPMSNGSWAFGVKKFLAEME